jgi:RNA-binding protein YlmH
MERGAIRIIDGPKGTSTTTYQITGTILDNPTKRQLVGDIAGL